MIKKIINFFLEETSYTKNLLRIYFQSSEGMNKFLFNWMKKNKDISIFQIGANDGIAGDPFFRYIKVKKIKSLAVEPIPSIFKQLEKNYKKANIYENSILLNFGVSESNYEKIYFFENNNEPNIPEYFWQLGTFNKDNLKEATALQPQLKIKDIEVKCVTVGALQKQYFYPKIIHIDTEGYDFEVIKTIDFSLPPKLIIYEYIHLSEEGLANSILFLQNKGYKINKFHMDIIAEM